jgi:hypothetical protein
MCENDNSNNKLKLQYGVDTRKLEIESFWKRSLFFWGFIAASFAAYSLLKKSNSNFTLIIANFGFLCSFFWTCVNRGSKYWQENWEQKVNSSEKSIIGDFFKIQEQVLTHKSCWLRARKFSVSRLTIALSDYVTILWFLIILFEIIKIFYPNFVNNDNTKCFLILFTIYTIIYSLIALFNSRTSNDAI